MLVIAQETVIRARPADVWRAWRPGFPMRPPEEESRNLDLYELAYGLKVPVTLVELNELRNWTVEHALPGGKLVVDHWLMPIAEQSVRVGKRYEVHGPMLVVYWLFFSRAIRRSIRESLEALERQANVV